MEFKARPDKTPQENGRLFERFWAKVFGVKPHKGSGNQWFLKLDVNDSIILWSLKHTSHQSTSITKNMMKEVEQAINAPGGIGGDAIPGIATSVDGEVYVILRAEDFLQFTTSRDFHYRPSKTEQKRLSSRVPSLLRD